MGLIQREIERAGMATASITSLLRYSRRVKPPRALFLDWPLGQPLGRPFDRRQQRAVLLALLQTLVETDTPGRIREPGWPWLEGIGPLKDGG